MAARVLLIPRRKEGNRGRGGLMASLTQWTWVWVNSGSWWWTGRPGVLWFMGSQRVEHDWATEVNWTGPFYLLIQLSLGQKDFSNHSAKLTGLFMLLVCSLSISPPSSLLYLCLLLPSSPGCQPWPWPSWAAESWAWYWRSSFRDGGSFLQGEIS